MTRIICSKTRPEQMPTDADTSRCGCQQIFGRCQQIFGRCQQIFGRCQQIYWRALVIKLARVGDAKGGIHFRNLFPIAIIHLGRHTLAGAKQAFGALRPARMRDPRIHIRPEPIFIAGKLFPEGNRPFIGEGKADNRFDRFEPIFPRRHQTDGRAILVGKRLAIDARGQKRQLVRRLVNGQPLNIGPGIPALFLARGNNRIHEGFHAQIFGTSRRPREFDQIGKRHSRPGTAIDHASTQRCR